MFPEEPNKGQRTFPFESIFFWLPLREINHMSMDMSMSRPNSLVDVDVQFHNSLMKPKKHQITSN